MKLSCLLFTLLLPALCLADQPPQPRHIDFKAPGGLGSGFLREQSDSLTAELRVGDEQAGRQRTGPEVARLDLQVWLLKSDGTCVPQTQKPSIIAIGSIGDYANECQVYNFQKVPARELSAIVLRINGKTYLQQLAGK
jgi:hypothetical protein